tara:strand:- start:54 stop:266 length:213 start_codon:yes stop_codon:yes gene_type:complete
MKIPQVLAVLAILPDLPHYLTTGLLPSSTGLVSGKIFSWLMIASTCCPAKINEVAKAVTKLIAFTIAFFY